MTRRVGVDLGTTWTAAAIANNAAAEILQLGTHTIGIPSVVAREGEGWVVGEAAERRIAADPASGVREMKRRLGDTTPMVVAGSPYGAEVLMSATLMSVLERARTQLGGDVEELVLTHPANWGGYKLDLLLEIARLAGREDALLVAEPVAAALHYASLGKLNAGDQVAVYDFGGGTFDVAVVRVDAGGAEVVGSPSGLERLGGVDIDQMVLVHVDGALDGKLRELDTTDPAVRTAIAELRAACTAAKETLTQESDALVPVNLPDLRTEVRITRAEFEAAVRERVADTLTSLDRTVASAGTESGALAGVLMVGGSARIPLVQEMVAAHTGRPLLLDVDAKAVVALGAAGGGAVESATAPPELAAAGAGRGGAGRAQRGRGKSESGSASTRVVAGAAGVAAAAGAVAAGVVGYGKLTDDGGSSGDESMDAFDEVVEADTAAPTEPEPAVAAVAPGVEAGVADAGDGGGVFSGSVGGRVAARLFSSPSGDGGGSRRSDGDDGGGAPVARSGAARPGSVLSDPGIETVRDQLAERLEAFTPPAGADPAEVAELREDLADLLEHYHPYPGQSAEDAIAGLRHAFEDRVHDFAQDQKLEALIDEQRQEDADAAALDARVDEFSAQLRDRLENWSPPPGADPAAVDEMRADLQGMLDRYTPIPGQSAEDALADLRERFNDRVHEFAQDQKIEAVVDELAAPDEPAPENTGIIRPLIRDFEVAKLEGVVADAVAAADSDPRLTTRALDLGVQADLVGAGDAAPTRGGALADNFDELTMPAAVASTAEATLDTGPPPGGEGRPVPTTIGPADRTPVDDDIVGDTRPAMTAVASADSIAGSEVAGIMTAPVPDAPNVHIPGLDAGADVIGDAGIVADPIDDHLDFDIPQAPGDEDFRTPEPQESDLDAMAENASLPDDVGM
jgi:actin-like ATPase involved in cell morphogenesis